MSCSDVLFLSLSFQKTFFSCSPVSLINKVLFIHSIWVPSLVRLSDSQFFTSVLLPRSCSLFSIFSAAFLCFSWITPVWVFFVRLVFTWIYQPPLVICVCVALHASVAVLGWCWGGSMLLPLNKAVLIVFTLLLVLMS